jgi:hypothetical protein
MLSMHSDGLQNTNNSKSESSSSTDVIQQHSAQKPVSIPLRTALDFSTTLLDIRTNSHRSHHCACTMEVMSKLASIKCCMNCNSIIAIRARIWSKSSAYSHADIQVSKLKQNYFLTYSNNIQQPCQ